MAVTTRSIFRLFDPQRHLILDLTDYMHYCDVVCSVDNTTLDRRYRISISGSGSLDTRKLFDLQCRGDWNWFEYEYKNSAHSISICLIGKVYIQHFSIAIPKWNLELSCFNVHPGRIQEEVEQKQIKMIQRGRRIVR